MTSEELTKQINDLEYKRRELLRADDQRQREKKWQRVEAFEKTYSSRAFASDDYAGLSSPVASFYYGYEATVCPVHGSDCEDDCDGSEWAFTVTQGTVEVMRLPKSALHPDADEPVMCLLSGIGIWLSTVNVTPKQA